MAYLHVMIKAVNNKMIRSSALNGSSHFPDFWVWNPASRCLQIQFLVVCTLFGLQEGPVLLCRHTLSFTCTRVVSLALQMFSSCRILDIRIESFLMVSFLNGYVCLQVWLCVFTCLWVYTCGACRCRKENLRCSVSLGLPRQVSCWSGSSQTLLV